MRTLVVMAYGQCWGFATELEEGEVFPVHFHTEGDPAEHITILAHGSIRKLPDGEILETKPGGTILTFAPGEVHGFVALTPGATFVNMLKLRK